MNKDTQNLLKTKALIGEVSRIVDIIRSWENELDGDPWYDNLVYDIEALHNNWSALVQCLNKTSIFSHQNKRVPNTGRTRTPRR